MNPIHHTTRPIINRDSFRFYTSNPEIGDNGTVEVTVNGETRRVLCIIDGSENIHVQNLYGRFGRSTRWWSLQVVSSIDGAEEYRIHEFPAPAALHGRVPDEIHFMDRALLLQEGGAA